MKLDESMLAGLLSLSALVSVAFLNDDTVLRFFAIIAMAIPLDILLNNARLIKAVLKKMSVPEDQKKED